MKNLFKILFIAVLFTACDETENVFYDDVNGQFGVGFTDVVVSVIVPEEGITTTVSVQATQQSASDRTFNVSVDESSTGSPADYTIGTVTIPANSYVGTLDVTFGNFNGLAELTSFTLVLNMEAPEGGAIVNSEMVTYNYLKKIICNDMVLTINEDAFADERNWNITDSTGAIVVQCSDFATCPTNPVSGIHDPAQYVHEFFLADGVYTFTILDAFGDGLFDGNITGNYALTCSLITHASGSGNFGGAESTEFSVNQ